MAEVIKRDKTTYLPPEALQKVKESSKTKFDATVELHINLTPDKKNKEANFVRFTVTLPHGTGKTKKVAVLASKKVSNADLELSETDIDKIENGKIRPKVDFDVLVAEPRFMPKLAKVAKILGPAGVMPNPKTGTVSENPEEAVAMVKKGKIDVKTEKDIPVIHAILGKVSFDEKDLLENFYEIYNTLKQNKPAKAKVDWIKSIFVASSMGPSFSIDITKA